MKFSDLVGLQSTLLLSKHTDRPYPTDGTSCVLQIIHSCGSHWIVATTIQYSASKVLIYVSLYASVDQGFGEAS